MIKTAIKLAIEGGYELPLEHSKMGFTKEGLSHQIGTYVLDPLFWQSLGKALGKEDIFGVPLFMSFFYPKIKDREKIEKPWWHCQMICFIDHLADNKDPELFFADLLKERNSNE